MATVRFRQGAGRLCLDFIRTLRYPGTAAETEELGDASALTAWAGQCGPVRVTASPSVRVEEARSLREAIRRLAHTALITDGPCPGDSRELINRAAAHPTPVPSLDAAGRLHWHADDPVRATLALVARDALDLATSPAAARLRRCAGPQCGAIFLDGSRPGTRRWCSMETCGNRAKKAGLRRRAAE
ncbi:MAG TPA: ABATE domain-containing protein [Actinoallomurus sp.]|jgi:predicted RNA-binding Zn ribbon-like protein